MRPQETPPQIDPLQAEVDVTVERLNLFYDLLQIEIEKLRRKSIEEAIINTRKEFEQQRRGDV